MWTLAKRSCCHHWSDRSKSMASSTAVLFNFPTLQRLTCLALVDYQHVSAVSCKEKSRVFVVLT